MLAVRPAPAHREEHDAVREATGPSDDGWFRAHRVRPRPLRQGVQREPAEQAHAERRIEDSGGRHRSRPRHRDVDRPHRLQPAHRSQGDQPGEEWTLLALRRPEPAAHRRGDQAGRQGLRVLAELRPLLGQDGEVQLLPRGDHRDRRPRRRRPHRRTPALGADQRRWAVEHVRGPGAQARPGAQVGDAGDAFLLQHPRAQPGPHQPAAQGQPGPAGRGGRRSVPRSAAGGQGRPP